LGTGRLRLSGLKNYRHYLSQKGDVARQWNLVRVAFIYFKNYRIYRTVVADLNLNMIPTDIPFGTNCCVVANIEPRLWRPKRQLSTGAGEANQGIEPH